MNNKAIAQIRKLQTGENRYCFECQTGSPTWASLPYGIYLCYNCSGLHRAMGVHLTFVRSIEMDSWTDKQLSMMHLGGNQQLRLFFQSHGIQIADSNKWKTNAAHYYREQMRALVNETQMPEEPEDWAAIHEAPKPQISQQQSQIQPDPPLTQEQQNFWEQASKSTKEAFAIIDEKISKVQIKEEAVQLGQQITAKTKQLGEKSTKIADKAYKSLKSGFNDAFGFIKSKADQVIGKEKQTQSEQQQQQQQQQQQYANYILDNQQQPQQYQMGSQSQKQPQDQFSFENNNNNNQIPSTTNQNQQQQINIMDYSDYFIDSPSSIVTQENPKQIQQINQQENLIDLMQDIKQPQQISETPNLLDL
ncbi:unnamed protein product [Paramecium octaurelia]|uniref:Arf-GAP domain-containing protein n=1 Tax=Paramecium octaurelia TaxID=43137 RepID=A0A8S1Y8T5_PAROT|nr:unnamed protein product [Paramecium octaurelia]